MSRLRYSILTCFLFAGTTGILDMAEASNHVKAPAIMLAQQGFSLAQAVEKIRKQTNGRILSAKKVNSAHPIYKIKVLMPTGQVKVFRVSAVDGELR